MGSRSDATAVLSAAAAAAASGPAVTVVDFAPRGVQSLVVDWETDTAYFCLFDGVNRSSGSLVSAALEDPSSSLYRGQLTRTADPAFAGSLRGCARVDGAEDVRVVGLVSAVPRVQAILEKYQDLPAPPVGSVVVSHFTIRLARDGKKASKPLKVLNPKFWRSRHCIVHRHEVVAALGLGNTVHERWLKPIGLVPCDVPEHLATPVVFKADKYADGLPVIRAGMLKPGHKYEVKFEDWCCKKTIL